MVTDVALNANSSRDHAKKIGDILSKLATSISLRILSPCDCGNAFGVANTCAFGQELTCITRPSPASDGGLACDEVVAFGFGVCLDRGEVGAARRCLPCLHFDFSQHKASIELNSLKPSSRDFAMMAASSLRVAILAAEWAESFSAGA
jgi:hypothetical protein